MVAVALGIFYIVFFFNELNVVLLGQQARHREYILHIAAHHAHARDVAQVLFRVGHGHRHADFFELAADALRRLDARLDMMDGVVAVLHAELAVERFQPPPHKLYARVVQKLNLVIGGEHFLEFRVEEQLVDLLLCGGRFRKLQ